MCDNNKENVIITEVLLKLLDATYSQAGLKHLIEIGFEILGNPFFICDLSYKVLGYSDCPLDDNVLNWDNIRNDKINYEAVLKLKSQGILDEIYKKSYPIRRHLSHEKIASMSMRTAINNKPVGHIVLYEYYKPITETDKIILIEFARAVSNELIKTEVYSQCGGWNEMAFVGMLNFDVKKDATRMKILAHNFISKKYLYILCISQDKKNPQNASLNYLNEILSQIIYDSLCVVYKNDIVVLIGNDSSREPFSAEVTKKLNKFISMNAMYAGLSTSFNDMSSLKKYYQYARVASWFGEIYDQKYRLYTYDDYYLFDLFSSLESNRNLNDFCHKTIMEMLKHDENSNTNYLQSTFCYLKCNKDLNKCAKEMCLHRNSMDYRIKKIEELFGIDFSDEDLCYSLYLSKKILQYTKIINY